MRWNIMRRAHLHCSEFVAIEKYFIFSYPFLCENYRTWIIRENSERYNSEYRRENN